MAGFSGCKRYGNIGQYRRRLFTLGPAITASCAMQVKKDAVYLVSEIKKGIKNQAPGGIPFKELADSTMRQRKRKRGKESTKALIDTADMMNAVTHVPAGPMSEFVGLLRTQMHKPKDGGKEMSMANLGLIHEQPHYEAAPEGIKRIPARPFVGPTAKKEMPGILDRFQAAAVAPLKVP